MFNNLLFNNQLKKLGSQHIHSTAYHPQHNGMIERWHRRLKDALRAAADDFSWVNRLPLIMLSLHAAHRDDGQPSPAEVVYGSSLTLPADLITPSSERIEHNILYYSHRLKAHMQNVRPIVTCHNTALNKTYHRPRSRNLQENLPQKNEQNRTTGQLHWTLRCHRKIRKVLHH